MASTRATNTPPPARKRMTLRQFEAFDREHEDERWDLIEGRPVMTPSPAWSHQKLSQILCGHIETLLTVGAGWLVVEDTSLRLPSLASEVRPDVAVYRQKEIADPSAFPLRAIPKLVIECLSPGKMQTDLVDKRGLYHKAGVPEYWIVDPKTGAITLLVHRKGEYDQPGVDPQGFIESPLLKRKLRIAVEPWTFRILEP
jgi:Uma2 family endonuclease